MRNGAKVLKGRFARRSCTHAAVTTRGQHTGQCPECGAAVATPITSTAPRDLARQEPSSSVGSCATGQLIDMADWRLLPPVESGLGGAA